LTKITCRVFFVARGEIGGRGVAAGDCAGILVGGGEKKTVWLGLLTPLGGWVSATNSTKV